VKVLLAGNQALFLEGLENLLVSFGIEVVGIATNGEEVLEKIKQLNPDIVMLNLIGNIQERLEMIHHVKIELPVAKIIAFADSEENLQTAERNGASGYLLSDIRGAQLVQKLNELEQPASNIYQ